VLTFGLSLLLQSAMTGFWSGEYRLLASPALGHGVALGGVALSHARLAAALAALAAVGALALGLRRARWGRAIRATSLDRDAASLLGIDVERATRLAFILAFGLAGGAGLLFATIHYLYPAAGSELTLLAITLAIWAGIGRMRALLLGGVALGVVEALTAAVAGTGWREPALALLLLASLLARGGALAREFGRRS
jgi:branched-chain amino acid transport system permease protein